MADKIEWNNEIKQKMLGLIPITSNFTINYTPEVYADIPDDFKPVFKVKPWNFSQIRELSQISSDDENKAYDLLSNQIVGMSNLLDFEGNEIPFEAKPDGTMSKTLMEQIPAKVLIDLLQFVSKISGAA